MVCSITNGADLILFFRTPKDVRADFRAEQSRAAEFVCFSASRVVAPDKAFGGLEPWTRMMGVGPVDGLPFWNF
jgi:hypothetical protein